MALQAAEDVFHSLMRVLLSKCKSGRLGTSLLLLRHESFAAFTPFPTIGAPSRSVIAERSDVCNLLLKESAAGGAFPPYEAILICRNRHSD